MVDDSSATNKFVQGWNFNLTSCGFYVQVRLISMFISSGDHMCSLCK
jgi:hypothetical protein